MFRYRVNIVVELRGIRTNYYFNYDEFKDVIKEVAYWKNFNGYREAHVYKFFIRV